MEVNDANVNAMGEVLGKTFNPDLDTRKGGCRQKRMPKSKATVRGQGPAQRRTSITGEGSERGRGWPPNKRNTDVHVPPFVPPPGSIQDPRKYSWTLLKCWSKRMYAAFEAHIKSEYLEYSRKALAKKFYTAIHGHKRPGIRTDDPEFQIFEIKNIGKLEHNLKGGESKLTVVTTDMRCANNMESNREIGTRVLISHAELADVLYESLKVGDYLAVWGAKYSARSNSAFLNSFGNLQAPETVMAIYRHENSLGPAENLDPNDMPFQERHVSHYLIQEGESGICNIVEEIYPKPKASNGNEVQHGSDEESGNDQEQRCPDQEQDEDDENDNDMELEEEMSKSSTSAEAKKNLAKPSTSAEARKNLANQSTSAEAKKYLAKQSPAKNRESPGHRKSRCLSNDGLLKELEKGSRSHSGSNSDSSIEIVEEFHGTDLKKGGSKRNQRANASKSKSNFKRKKGPDFASSDEEKSDDKEDSASDSDSSFVTQTKTKSRKKRGRRTSSGSSDDGSEDSLMASPKKPTRPRRATKNAKARRLSESMDLTSPIRSTRAAKNSKTGRRPSGSSASNASPGFISGRPRRPAKKTEVTIFEESGNEDEPEPPSKTPEKPATRSPKKTATPDQGCPAPDKDVFNANKSKDSESQPLSQTSIVLELDTQRFGVPTSASKSQSQSNGRAKGDNGGDNDDDSDWNPPGENEKGASGSEKENEKSESKKKSQSSDSSDGDSDSDEESLETKRQKLEGIRVKRKLFIENEEENPSSNSASPIPIPEKWTSIVKPCRIQINYQFRERADKFAQSSSSQSSANTNNGSGSKRQRK